MKIDELPIYQKMATIKPGQILVIPLTEFKCCRVLQASIIKEFVLKTGFSVRRSKTENPGCIMVMHSDRQMNLFEE